MIKKAYYSSTGERPLEEIKHLKIIDIGGANSFAHGYLDAIVEIREPQAPCNHKFIGDINRPEVWEDILEHVRKHGEWDYAICTHTLEDIHNPIYVCEMIQEIAKAGIIIEPSKYRELARFTGGAFRGFIHHHWLFDIIDGKFTGFPKLNYLEESIFDHVHHKLEGREELIVHWEGLIDAVEVNEGMPFNGEEHLKELYHQLITNPFDETRPAKTKLITTTNDRSKCDKLEKSLQHFGWDYEIIVHPWYGFLSKIHETYKYLKSIEHEYSHFLYTDAWDTVVMQKPNFSLPGGLLISAERACYPHPEKEPLYPAHASPWKFVNGGGWGGEIKAFIEMYEKCPPTSELNDQVYLTERFLNREREGNSIQLDYLCRFFQTIAFCPESDFKITGTDIINTVHSTTPFIWHGNGHTNMDWIYRHFDSLT